MAKKIHLKKMRRKELIEIIYALQQEQTVGDKDLAKIPDVKDVETERKRLFQKREYRRITLSTIYALLVVAAAAALLATLFFPVLQVEGTSMEPTLNDGDVILLIKTKNFETGDLCGFYWQNKLLLKRVIGNSGDIINITNDGQVYVNGELLDEPYVADDDPGESDIIFPYQVPENRCFVLGDHRGTSIDSRNSKIGCIEKEQIVGEVVLRIWPLKEFSLIK